MNRSWLVAGVLGLVAATSVAASAVEYTPGATTAGDPYFPRYGNGGYDAVRYDLDVRYDPGTDLLAGTATVTAVAEQPLSAFTLDLVGLTVTGATVDGTAAGVSHVGRKLTLTPATGIDRGSTFTTVVSYGGIPATVDTPALGRSGWFHTDDGAIVVGQPASAAFWFPVNDHPADKARLSADVTVPDGLEVLSNGVSSAPTTGLDGWRTFHWQTRDPMVSYLATVAIGRFRVDRLVHRSGLVVTTAVDASLGRFVDRQLQRTEEVFRFLRREIGAYPFEAVGGIADVAPVGFALETQTIPVYSDLFFARGLDSSWVIAHELAHQWFGDSVSLRRWRDIWLNEGLATYFEWVWTADQRGSTAYRTARRVYDRIDARDRFWDVVIGDPGPRRLFDLAVYYRGAMTVAQLEHRMGARRFDRLVTGWIGTYRNSHATTRDFVRLAEDTCGCGSLDRLFRQWLYTPGKPRWR